MQPGGSLEPIFSPLVGSGPGAGMSLLFLLSGVGVALTCLVGYTSHSIRNIENILPDHDAAQRIVQAAEGEADHTAPAAEAGLAAGQ